MTLAWFLRVYAASLLTLFAIDLVWLGVVARGFYRRHLGATLRPDVLWLPAVAFYLIYVAAVVILVVQPAAERASLGRAIAHGALFGLAAYSAYDLTSLALVKDFPPIVALVDLAWGTALTAAVSAAGYGVARALG